MNSPTSASASPANKGLFITGIGLAGLSMAVALVTVFSGIGAPAPVAAAYSAFQAPAALNSSVKITANAETRLGTYTLEPATLPPFYDFMVPDVCLDAAGNVTSEDPAKCTKKRNLRIGESLPYILADYAAAPGWQQSYIYASSFPVIHRKDIRVVQTREWGANSGHPGSAAFRDFGPLDAYDIMSSNGAYVSSIGTRDPIMNSPGFYWAKPDCTLQDSWIQFPIGLKKGETSYTVANLIGGYLPCTPSSTYSTSLTVWNWYTPSLPYSSGKQLDSIQTWHHSGTDPVDATKALDAMEVFRWTKEYGLTRWEGWVTATSTVAELMGWETAEEVAAAVKLHKDSKSCDGGDPLDRWGYIMSRWGCADFTFVYAPDAKRGSLTPYSFPIKKEFVTSLNLLSTDEKKARADAAGGSLLGWKTLALGGGKAPTLKAKSDATTSKNLPTSETPAPNNNFYNLTCTDACGTGNPRSMYLDVNPSDIVKEYGSGPLTVQAGGLVRGPAKAMNATLAVHLMDANGAIMTSRSASLTAASSTYAMKVTGFSTTTATSTSPARLNVHWDGITTYKTIPYGSQVLIGDKVYSTISGTGVGLIYLSATTTGIKVGDPVKHLQGPDGKVIYSDVGATSGTGVWNQVRFNFDWDFAARPVANMRYELYVRSPGEYHLDETFVALLPSTASTVVTNVPIPQPQTPVTGGSGVRTDGSTTQTQ
jgi:hypothetical protein